jgi:two-component system invasion response regulator UvrY
MAVQRASGQRTPIDVLTAKEFSVFLALAQGRSVNDNAATKSLSPSTVGSQLNNNKQKLGAANSAELALIAIRNGLIVP